ncbi:AAA family ATPase [Cohnella hongkongensis]|uniref:AAA family ATPase n=1 Tax=Cohnella hongkongensis TaxID=178337 RepID=A0ABV9FIE8_9BACL
MLDIDRIQEGLRNKAVLLCAPAGFGKSVLLQQWAEQAAEQPAWFSVDRSDNDIARFWHHTIRAIDFVHPGFKERAGDIVRPIRLHPSRPEAVLSPLLSELRQLQRPLVFVLDDFHAITDSALLTSFAYFLEHLPNRVRLILSGRTWPAIPCLPDCGTVERIGAEELRFTARESGDFFSTVMEIQLSREEKDRWVRRTEGWEATMKLAALHVRLEPPAAAPPIRPFSGGSHLLEQYILEEVFGPQSEPIQRFLLDCSILKRMNASLCEAVSGNAASGAILEQLERGQLFIMALDPRKEWFRFGHLFAEFLRQRLERLEPERASKLLEAAGRWCEQEGWKEEALDYYLAGKHDDRAIRLLEGILLNNGRVIAWGANVSGQSIVPPQAEHGVIAIAAGEAQSLALKADGSVLAWGWNDSGQTIVPAEAQSGVTAIAAGREHSLALKDGGVIAWGSSSGGKTSVPVAA